MSYSQGINGKARKQAADDAYEKLPDEQKERLQDILYKAKELHNFGPKSVPELAFAIALEQNDDLREQYDDLMLKAAGG